MLWQFSKKTSAVTVATLHWHIEIMSPI